jgi:hypothetical protein
VLDVGGLKLWVMKVELDVNGGKMVLRKESEVGLKRSVLNYDLFRGGVRVRIRDVKEIGGRIVLLVEKGGEDYLVEFSLEGKFNVYGVPESVYMNCGFPGGSDGEMSIADKGFVFATISESFSNPRQSFCEESAAGARVRKFDVNLWVHRFDPEYELRVLKIVKDVELSGPMNFEGEGGKISKNFTNERVDFAIYFERFNINSNLDFVRNSTGQVVLLTSSGLKSQTCVVCDLKTLTPEDLFEQHLISNSVQYFYSTIFLKSHPSPLPPTTWYEFIQSNLPKILNLPTLDPEPETLKNRILTITQPLSPSQNLNLCLQIYQSILKSKNPTQLPILKHFLDLHL